MVNKVRQTIAGFAALRADKNMKKAAANRAKASVNAEKFSSGRETYYSKDFQDNATSAQKGAMLSSVYNAGDRMKRQRGRAKRQEKRAARQYSRANRLMGY